VWVRVRYGGADVYNVDIREGQVYGGVGGQMSRTRGGAAGLPSVAVRMINGHVADDDASVGRSVGPPGR